MLLLFHMGSGLSVLLIENIEKHDLMMDDSPVVFTDNVDTEILINMICITVYDIGSR